MDYTVDNITLHNTGFLENDNSVEFNLKNCKLIHIDNGYLKVHSKSLEVLYPFLIAIEKKFELTSSFELEEFGICFNINSVTDNKCFKNILSFDKMYDIECKLHTVKDSRLTCKILRISDAKASDFKIAQDNDIAEPDNIDIEDIKLNIARKIKKLKKKYLEISKLNVHDMNLAELILMEDNLYDFFQNNI